MRARRLLDRRPKALRSRTQASPAFAGNGIGRQNGHSRIAPESQSLPLPTVFSPRHPSSFRFEHGLYKYATGLVAAAPTTKRSLEATDASFKIYSTKPLWSSTCAQVRNFLAKGDHPAATNLGEALRHLYRMSVQAHTTSDSVAGVFFQVFRTPGAIRPLRLPWTILRPPSRQWNLSCETYRAHPDAGISLPRILLSIPAFDEDRAILHGPWSKTINKIGVQLFADLKPSTLHYDLKQQATDIADRDRSRGFIQAIVDDMLFAMAQVKAPRNFADPLHLVLKLKSAILSYLKTSALRPLVNYQTLEIVIMDPYRQRYVLNILLNSDGSERDAHEKKTVASLPGSEAENECGTTLARESGSRTTRIALSELTARKIGVGQISGDVVSQQSHPADSPPISGAEAIQAFDTICQNLEETGLMCCIKAAQFLALRHSNAHVYLTSDILSNSVSSGVGMFFRLDIDGKGNYEQMVVHLSSYTMGVHLTQSSKTSVHILGVSLVYKLSEDVQQDFEDANKRQTTAGAEISILSQAFESISRTFLDKMVFQSYDEIPSRLAAAVLELLEVPAFGITLQSVRLSIKPVDDSEGVFSGRASRKTELSTTMRGSDVKLSPSRHAILDLSGGPKQSNESIRDVTEQSSTPPPSDGGEAHKDLRPSDGSHSLSLTHSKNIAVAVRKHRKLNVDQLLSPQWIPLEELTQKTGFETYRLSLTLPKSVTPRTDLTTERINARIQRALDASFQFGLSCFQDVLLSLANLGSRKSKLTLMTRLNEYSTSSEIRTSGIRAGLEVTFSRGVLRRGADTLTIHLPAFMAPVQLVGRQLTPDIKAHLMFALQGTFPRSPQVQEKTATEQIFDLFLEIYRMTTEMLNRQTYTTFQELASDVTNTLLESRSKFRSTLEIHKVELQASLRPGHYANPAIDKASVSKGFGLNVAVEHGSELESAKGRPLDLGQERELETEQQTEVEAGNVEANPAQFLDPKYDVNIPEQHSESPNQQESNDHKVFIALGSNVGDRLGNIENACQELDADPDIRIIQTSPLYETAPMYVLDQNRFLNGVCQIETTLEPMVLLDRLKAIEDRLGRVKTIEKGPRSIDLDILLYGNLSMATDRLTVPHPLMKERNFVLRPLQDMRKTATLPIRADGLTVEAAWNALPKTTHPMLPIVPLGPKDESLRATDRLKVTRVMSILNITPDSFSDGGDNEIADIEKLKETVRSQIAAGATIIDIGGQSSRPNAPDVTSEDEISRVLPAIEAVRSLPEAANIAISVDTYRASVADAAITAGAHIINDISAGKLDPEMFATVARLGCTYVMMHMRGTPATMMSDENCTYEGDLIDRIALELDEQLDRAQKAGVRRWRIILDPGIGFSKTPEQNVEILRRLPRFHSRLPTYPWLVGTSRKSFIGKLTGVHNPKDRIWGTAATVAAAVRGGADIVRVHDVEEMATVVKMADAIYRVYPRREVD